MSYDDLLISLGQRLQQSRQRGTGTIDTSAPMEVGMAAKDGG